MRGDNYETMVFTAIAWDHGPRIEAIRSVIRAKKPRVRDTSG